MGGRGWEGAGCGSGLSESWVCWERKEKVVMDLWFWGFRVLRIVLQRGIRNAIDDDIFVKTQVCVLCVLRHGVGAK